MSNIEDVKKSILNGEKVALPNINLEDLESYVSFFKEMNIIINHEPLIIQKPSFDESGNVLTLEGGEKIQNGFIIYEK